MFINNHSKFARFVLYTIKKRDLVKESNKLQSTEKNYPKIRLNCKKNTEVFDFYCTMYVHCLKIGFICPCVRFFHFLENKKYIGL